MRSNKLTLKSRLHEELFQCIYKKDQMDPEMQIPSRTVTMYNEKDLVDQEMQMTCRTVPMYIREGTSRPRNADYM